MLLRFWAENVLSLRDRQELSLVATELNEGSARPAGVRVDSRDVQAVPVAAIYGSNASGKSNVLKALNMMRQAVLGSVTWANEPDPIRRIPFLLDEHSKSKPSVFGVEIAIDGVRYKYGFEMDDRRVVAEWLYAYPTGRKQVWFERDVDATPQFRFRGEGLRGARQDLVEQTRDDALFLAVGAQFNNPQLARVHAWFLNSLRATMTHPFDRHVEPLIALRLAGDEELRRRVEQLLRVADVGITGLTIVETSVPSVRLVHQAGDRSESFDFERESFGTRAWLMRLLFLLYALDRGAVVAVDELDASLHPRMVAEIVNMFASPRSNPRGAQLVFTTHDVSLLGNLPVDRLLDRDEVWLTEKDDSGATELYPLTDLKPRKDENLERGYLLGRYGAVPRVVTGQLARAVEGGPVE
jgi:AAA15 family ATPase/GTPase